MTYLIMAIDGVAQLAAACESLGIYIESKPTMPGDTEFLVRMPDEDYEKLDDYAPAGDWWWTCPEWLRLEGTDVDVINWV